MAGLPTAWQGARQMVDRSESSSDVCGGGEEDGGSSHSQSGHLPHLPWSHTVSVLEVSGEIHVLLCGFSEVGSFWLVHL